MSPSRRNLLKFALLGGAAAALPVGRAAASLSERLLQQAVDSLVFEARQGTTITLSISAGAAVFPQDGDSYDALLAMADSRMYLDKGSRKRGDAQRPASDTYRARTH